MRAVLIAGSCIALLACAFAYAAQRSQGPIGLSTRHQPYACINNLRVLDGVKQQFAIEHGKTNGEPVTMADLVPYLNKASITCREGGHYELRAIGLDPVCSLGTNRVAWTRKRILWYTFSADSGSCHRLPQ